MFRKKEPLHISPTAHTVSSPFIMLEDCLLLMYVQLVKVQRETRRSVHRGMACRLAVPPYTPRCSRGYGSSGNG